MENRNGFISAQVLGVVIIASLAGAYLLQSASKEAGTSGSYVQMRSAATSAQAGLADALTQLETDTAQAVAMLKGYLKDGHNAWMLGNGGVTCSPNEQSLPTAGQKYTARILGFDSTTDIIKIQAVGTGMGGSAQSVIGIYRLDGLSATPPPPQNLHALYVAGDGRVVNGPINVKGGPAYFGGGVRFTAAANGTQFNYSFHCAPSPAGTVTSFDAQTNIKNGWSFDYDGPALFETPVHTMGPQGVHFDHDVAFQENEQTDGAIYLNGNKPKTLFTNANFAGSIKVDASGWPVVHSGLLNPASVVNASSITNRGSEIDLAAATGIPSGLENSLQVDISVIPAANIFTPAQLGLPAAITAKDISNAYNSLSAAQRFGKFMVINVDAPLAFALSAVPADNHSTYGVLFLVNSAIAVNGNLPKVDGSGNWMFYVPSGGAMTDFGGNDFIQGYVHVTGTGSVSYKWGPNNDFNGAIHHVSPQCGWQYDSPKLLNLTLDRGVLKEYADLGIIAFLPGDPSSLAAASPGLHMTDAKIRPVLLGLYY